MKYFDLIAAMTNGLNGEKRPIIVQEQPKTFGVPESGPWHDKMASPHISDIFQWIVDQYPKILVEYTDEHIYALTPILDIIYNHRYLRYNERYAAATFSQLFTLLDPKKVSNPEDIFINKFHEICFLLSYYVFRHEQIVMPVSWLQKYDAVAKRIFEIPNFKNVCRRIDPTKVNFSTDEFGNVRLVDFRYPRYYDNIVSLEYLINFRIRPSENIAIICEESWSKFLCMTLTRNIDNAKYLNYMYTCNFIKYVADIAVNIDKSYKSENFAFDHIMQYLIIKVIKNGPTIPDFIEVVYDEYGSHYISKALACIKSEQLYPCRESTKRLFVRIINKINNANIPQSTKEELCANLVVDCDEALVIKNKKPLNYVRVNNFKKIPIANVI